VDLKISALEIERILLKNTKIHEICVVGVPDEEWGERVGAVYVGDEMNYVEFKNWCKLYLANYKIPSKLVRIEKFERNVMGKIDKSKLKSKFQ